MTAGDPVIVKPDEDPLTVLRTMAKFVSERRGIAEIWSPPPKGAATGVRIGYVVLCRQPEEKPVPIYCAATRTIQHMMLADWLHARGYEASSCVWERIHPWSSPAAVHSIPAGVAWKLVIREAKVPPLPPTPLSEGDAAAALAMAVGAGSLGAGLAAHGHGILPPPIPEPMNQRIKRLLGRG